MIYNIGSLSLQNVVVVVTMCTIFENRLYTSKIHNTYSASELVLYILMILGVQWEILHSSSIYGMNITPKTISI